MATDSQYRPLAADLAALGRSLTTPAPDPELTAAVMAQLAATPTPQTARRRPRIAGARSCSSYPSAGRLKAVASPDLPSTSTMSTVMPVRAAATAKDAVTVVLPTPPLPATMTTREVEQK